MKAFDRRKPINVRLAGLLAILLVSSGTMVGQAEYRARELKISKGTDIIAGTLLVPEGRGPFPAVVFLHGSEAGSRKMPHYHRAATRLLKEGIAVLITDKPGVGDSTGTYIETPNMNVRAAETATIVEFVAKQEDIDPSQIGVMGWSQGGWVGPLAATLTDKIRFVITVSGPAVTVQEQVIYQRGQELIDKGFSRQDVDDIAEFRRYLWTYYGTARISDGMRAAVESAKTKPWFGKIDGATSTFYPADALAAPRFQFFRNLQYDPAPALKSIKVPLLAVFGQKDRLIPVKESTERLLLLLTESGHNDFTIRVFPDAGHGVQLVDSSQAKAAGGANSQPTQIPTPAPGYWELVTEWIKKRTSGARKPTRDT